MTNVVVPVAGLHKWFRDVRTVDGLDLEIYAGEVFGLLGPNGAGKTTTIRILLGLTRPSRGRVELLGLLLILATGILLGIAITAISATLVLTPQGHGPFFSIISFVSLPLLFASNALAPLDVMPPWFRTVALLNPMTYAVSTVRVLVLEGVDWPLMRSMGGALIVFDIAAVAASLWAMSRALD